MENPYLQIPYKADAWWIGFLRGYSNINIDFQLPASVSETDSDAYGEGVQAGRQASIDGLNMGNNCIPASEESHDAEILGSGAWAFWTVGTKFVAAGGPAGVVARGLITILRLALHTRHTVDPNWILPQLAEPLIGELQRAEVGSVGLYLGVGRDPSAEGCEFLTTGLFPSIDQAREAVLQLGRVDWLIAEWRTDQSFRVAEYSDVTWG